MKMDNGDIVESKPECTMCEGTGEWIPHGKTKDDAEYCPSCFKQYFYPKRKGCPFCGSQFVLGESHKYENEEWGGGFGHPKVYKHPPSSCTGYSIEFDNNRSGILSFNRRHK